MTVTVNIIEKQDNRSKIYDEIKSCFLEPKIFFQKDLVDKYEVNQNAVVRIRKEICKDLKITYIPSLVRMYSIIKKKGKIKTKSSKKEDSKFYVYSKSRYRVQKTLNGVYTSYFSYDNEEDAMRVVSELKKVNWDKKRIMEILEKLGLEHVLPQNYRRYFNKFLVYKSIDGERRIYGRYDSEEDAKMIVSMLRKENWDIEKLPLIEKEIGIMEGE